MIYRSKLYQKHAQWGKDFSQLLYIKRFASRLFSDRVKKLVVYFGLYESSLGLPEKRRPNKYCLWEVNLFFCILIVILICQSVDLSRKIAVQNAGRIFAYFCGGHKNNTWSQCRISFNRKLLLRIHTADIISFTLVITWVIWCKCIFIAMLNLWFIYKVGGSQFWLITFNHIQDEVSKKTPYHFFPCNFCKCRNEPQTFFDF